MPRRRVRVSYADFTGGLNEDQNPSALAPSDLRIARNMYWRGRALSTRNGSSRLQSTAINSGAAGVGLFDFVWSAGANRNIVGVFGNAMYKDVQNATPTAITGAVTITAGQNNLCTFDMFNDELIVVNGADSPWKWTGSGNIAALGGSPPAFNTILAKWNRVFGAGHLSAPRTIRHSDLGDHEIWTATNTVPALVGDASGAVEGRDFIWQLGHLGDSIFCGLAHSIGRVFATGDSVTPFRYTQVANFGQDGAHTYVAVGDNGYFLSTWGVHFIRNSDVALSFESSLISRGRLGAFWDALNKNRIKYSVGTLYHTTYGNLLVLWPLTTGSGSTHDIVLVMDVTEGPGRERFSAWVGWAPNYLAPVLNSSTLAELLYFCTTVGFVWRGDTGTDDNGAAYFKEAATRWEDFGLPAQKKNLRDLYIELVQSGTHNVNIDVIFDYSTTPSQTITQTVSGSTQAAWGTAVWGSSTWPTLGFVRAFLPGFDDGEVVSFRFYTDGANEPFTLLKFVPAVQAGAETIEG